MLSAWRPLARIPGLFHPRQIALPSRSFHYSPRPKPKFDIFKTNPTIVAKSIDDLLQYRGPKKKLLVRPDGYMKVTDILRSLNWHTTTLKDFQRYARTKTQGRYEFAHEPDVFEAMEKDDLLLWMRRTAHLRRKQPDVVHFRVLDPKQLPMAVYKAPRKEWKTLKSNGIRREDSRTLVRLSPMEYVEENTGSIGTFLRGMLRLTNPEGSDPVETSFVYINLDVEKALRGGVDFYKTRSNNIVTPGDRTGVIKPEYYKDVTFVDVDQEVLR
ncbi:hypothetical protein BKA70DRAFT_156862 [Coprinopsis sp. MPI-PUGE-AT-0042]|nr:hypothetical protein BKA70DRAFT_156862 [Coprinopsis sp. MPI-PUGE-AT-0042]